MECPKCKYVRSAADNDVPEIECPKCGVIYAKVQQQAANEPQLSPLVKLSVTEVAPTLENDGAASSSSAGRKRTLKRAYMVLIVLIGAGATIVGAQLWGRHKALSNAHELAVVGLKDPDSALFRKERVIDAEGQTVVCGEVNARNSMGGYVGYKNFVVVLPSGAAAREDSLSLDRWLIPDIRGVPREAIEAILEAKEWQRKGFSTTAEASNHLAVTYLLKGFCWSKG